MSFKELLPLLLGLIWILIIPMIRKNAKAKANTRAVSGSDDVASGNTVKSESTEDIFRELFGIPETLQEPVLQKPAEPQAQHHETKSPKRYDYVPVSPVDFNQEGISAFNWNEFSDSSATFSENEETVYRGINLKLKENIRQAVIFSEILKRPYTD